MSDLLHEDVYGVPQGSVSIIATRLIWHWKVDMALEKNVLYNIVYKYVETIVVLKSFDHRVAFSFNHLQNIKS